MKADNNPELDPMSRFYRGFAIHAFMTRLPRGRKKRRLALQEMEEAVRFQWVLLRITLICAGLWALFYLQFLLSFLYSTPFSANTARNLIVHRDITYFLPVDGWTSASLASRFLLLSLVGAVLSWVVAWSITRGVPGRHRMRFAVCLFSAILLGYSGLNVSSESAAWETAEQMRDYYAEQAQLDSSDSIWYEHWQERINYYDNLLDRRRR